ncbi:hypothetical protein [Gulosibacter sediminis]|uniref:hypothetical protein n=1 Tax=Gulosibacter sediminis TaxID=1729695 RepID=UPI0024A7FB98|nr:hypothetical protein [Gulosibacter sediminis]
MNVWDAADAANDQRWIDAVIYEQQQRKDTEMSEAPISNYRLERLLDAENFAEFVGKQLRGYDAGNGDYAHDVLAVIQTEYLKFWTIPDGGDDAE